jgi:hypothetical protein
MLTLFKKIRKSLLDGGKTSRYLVYAVGEIALVVIGILIALQINNWNDYRKDRIKEEKVLLELAKTLNSNCEVFQQQLNINKGMDNSNNVIIEVLENDLAYHDSLNLYFHLARLSGTYLSFSTAGYEGLKNVGFDIIRSDSIKTEIIDLFEVDYNSFINLIKYFESFLADRQKYIDGVLHYDQDNYNPDNPFFAPLTPFDFKQLLDDNYYLAMMKSVKVQRNVISVRISTYLKSSQRILQLINDELND